MTFNTLVAILLFALLSGCQVFGSAVEAAALAHPPIPTEPNESKTNYYEPVVLSSNKDAISIKYLTVNSNAMHGEVIKLFEENCDGSYVEISRQEIEGWTTMEAECT